MKGSSRIVFKNSAFGLGAQLIIKVVSFAFSVLIVRNLGADAFGQYAAVGAFGFLFLFIADLGLGPYAIREVARFREAPDGKAKIASLYGNVLLLRLLLSALAGVLTIIAAWLTQRPLIMIGAIALNTIGWLMYAVQGSSDAALSGYERLDVSSTIKVLQQLIFVAGGTLALYVGWGYYGLILANLLSIGLMTHYTLRAVHRLGVRIERPKPSVWKSLIRASLPFGILGFALGLSYNFDTVLLNITRGDAETGYYSAAYRLIFSFVLLSNVLNTALYPTLSRRSASQPSSLDPIYERTMRYLLIVALPITVGISVLADQLVPLLFKDGYTPAVPALKILVFVVPFMYVSEFLGYVVVIDNRERIVARAVIISTTVNVLLNLLLVPRFGYLAAAAMTVVTEAVLVGQYVWLLRDRLRHFDIGAILIRPAIAALVMGATLALLHSSPLFIVIPLGGLVYVLLLMVFRVIGRDEYRLVRSIVAPSRS